MSELLAPGGSFASAVRALENGADAVYLGLSEFSARKGAVNFSLEDLRRLRGGFPHKSLYLALNTLVADADLPRAGKLLQDARDCGIDALIVQDPGIALIARRLFPDLPLHASTQMSVYEPEGAAELADAGFTRAVLARECTLEEIRTIGEEVPGLELEIFIHGALCYGFSGLCQASQVLLGRSANRGACGQVCRTWFEEGGRGVFPFSMNDLAAGPMVRELADAGVASLKIEGRMKGPDYAATVCRYYRALLDGDDSGSPGEAGSPGKGRSPAAGSLDADILADEAALAFSRNRTPGWLEGGKGRNMLNPDFAGATGLAAGRVLERDRRGMLLEAASRLESRDGLLWLGSRKGMAPPEPIQGGLRFREKERHVLEAGKSAWIEIGYPPEPGSEIRLVSRGGRMPAEVKAASFQPARTEIDLRVVYARETLVLRGSRDGFEYEMTLPGPMDAARVSGRFTGAVEKAFAASGDSVFRCRVASVGLPEDGPEPFIPPGQLKELRRRFLDEFTAAYTRWKAERLRSLLDPDGTHGAAVPEAAAHAGAAPAAGRPVSAGPVQPAGFPAARQLIAADCWAPLPFPVEPSSAKSGSLPVIDGIRYLPLPPVIFDRKVRDSLLESIGESLVTDSRPLLVGLANQGHLPAARRLAEGYPEEIESGRLGFFLDSSLYVVNRMALEWYRSRIPGLGFFVECLEGRADGWKGVPGIPMMPRGDGLRVPMFIGRTCPVRHAGLDGNPKPGTCPPGCPGSRDFIVTQNGREDRVFIRNCQAWVVNSQ